ncbi:hypothetical protein [Ruminiclostridium papyrosolvens]|uniref:Uncharacterized protein n=1 Tax=Ruminiclostridium papyrosolvens C7 TaxID=1330534 RepID=U4QX01_9FIRM|nr:hypothetical protein [Ruminiclostridium papyrosolvens]EPR08091.1 hypothetical protein L323_18300 [Ruminiclostridium papyrosolvens C7]
MTKWESQFNSENILKRVTAKKFIGFVKGAKPIERFEADLFFKLVEKVVVYEDGVSVGLLDGSEVRWE